MPRIRVPIRRAGIRQTRLPGRRYPMQPARPASSGGLLALLGGLGGVLICLLCLATMGILGLFATFIAITAYVGDLYRALRDIGSSGVAGLYVNSIILLAALCFAAFHKLHRSL